MSGAGQTAGIPGRSEISLGVRFIVLVVIALALMVVDHRQNHLDRVRQLLGLAVYPIQLVVDLPFNAWNSISAALTDRDELLREVDRLRTQELYTDLQLQELESLRMENARLRDLLGSSERVEGRVLIAEILSTDPDRYRHRLIINRGAADGVDVDQPMLDADGVVGQIVSVTPMTAEAMLITDPAAAVPVSVLRNGLRTIVEGTGDSSQLRLPYITSSADIVVGDLLVTSGLGGVFPPGRPVAEITEIKPQSGRDFAEVVARPVAALDRGQAVLLVGGDDGINGRHGGAEL